MKVLKVLTIVLAIGAIFQAVAAYSSNTGAVRPHRMDKHEPGP